MCTYCVHAPQAKDTPNIQHLERILAHNIIYTVITTRGDGDVKVSYGR
jgi:disulfide oxidoreductase YuzD